MNRPHFIPLAGKLPHLSLLSLTLLRLAGQQVSDLRGRVVDLSSGQGLPGAVVRLYAGPEGSLIQQVSSDSDGGFRLSDLEPGEYIAQAAKPGYAPPQWRPQGVVLAVRPGAAVETIIGLAPSGTITGSVRQWDGTPVRSARVSALLRGPGDHLTIYSATLTGIRGQYRLSGLAPGKYVIMAMPSLHPAPETVFEPTYWPSARELARAEPILVRPGAERHGVDFAVGAALGFDVAGRVTHGNEGAGLAALAVMAPAAPWSVWRWAETDAEGRFELKQIPAGRWKIVAGAPVAARGQSRYWFGASPQFGEVTVEGPPSVSDIVIPLSPPANLEGQILPLEGAEVCMRQSSITLELWASPFGPERRTAKPEPNGKFLFSGLKPGEYRVTLALPRGCYIDGFKQRGKPATARLALEAGQSTSIQVYLAGDGGMLEGKVLGEQQADLPAVVFLVPAAPPPGHEPPVYVREAKPSGAYLFESLPPGDYLAVALPAAAGHLGYAPEVWRGKEETRHVRIRPGERVTCDLRLLVVEAK
jgi:hypothetical protein